MLYRTVPKTGESLSALGYGCMRLPLEGMVIDEERATRQIRSAIDRGVNYVDTAWPYHAGQSETWLGKALADGYREKVNLATKLPSWLVESREDMDLFLDAQLKKINTEHIDYYLLHALDGAMWDKLKGLDVFDFMKQAVADGRVRNFGFSFHGALEDFKRIIDDYDWTFCQIQYNFLDEQNQAGTEGLEYAAAKDIAIIIMEPLRGGSLSHPSPPEAVDAIWKKAEVSRTPVEWALRWVWNHPEVTVVLSGMNEEAHIEENITIAEAALAGSLTDKELALISEAADTYRKIMKVGCTGCGYCLPCPSGVNIPVCFEIYNNLHMYGDREDLMFGYIARAGGIINNEPALASQCVQCGECLEKCPQDLEIPDFLEAVVQDLEGEGFEQRKKMITMVMDQMKKT